jgi:hypothetical protein
MLTEATSFLLFPTQDKQTRLPVLRVVWRLAQGFELLREDLWYLDSILQA